MREAVDRAVAEDVHLAILDVSMPRMTGIQAAAELRKRKPELRVLMLSMYDSEQFLFESLKAGASGYVLKSDADHDIVDACRRTMRGQSFLYPSAVTTLVRDYVERGRPRRRSSSTYSRRASCEVLKLIAEAYTSKEIAKELIHQHQDGGAPPPEHPRQARDERPRRAHPLRNPPRSDPALARPSGSDTRNLWLVPASGNSQAQPNWESSPSSLRVRSALALADCRNGALARWSRSLAPGYALRNSISTACVSEIQGRAGLS